MQHVRPFGQSLENFLQAVAGIRLATRQIQQKAEQCGGVRIIEPTQL